MTCESTDHDHAAFMQLAIDQGEVALSESEVPIGCVIVLDGKVLGTGRNRTNQSFNATRHAEIEAIEEIISRRQHGPEIFKQCSLYVTCEPCVMCASLLRRLQFHHVYFGCWNERFGGCGTVLSIHSDPLPMPCRGSPDSGPDGMPVLQCTGGLRREEAIMLLRRFYLQENERGNLIQ
jgi:tRNA-specific adenosine deaminase 2